VGVSYFAVVRYVADVERNEPLNVGVLLTTPTAFRTRFVRRDEVHDWSVVERFSGLLQHELDTAETPTDVLRDLATRRFPGFEISEPRQVTQPGDLDLVANDLALRLVETTSSLQFR
jgi:hypothetical protein